MAGNTEFIVTTERLNEAANHIQEKTNSYNSDIQKLYSEANSLTSGAWTGIASDEFRKKLESYRSEFDSLKSNLLQFSDALKEKANNYDKTEDNVANNARAL